MTAAGDDPTQLLSAEADRLIAAARADEQANAMQKFLPMLVYWWGPRSGLRGAEKKTLGARICQQVLADMPRPFRPAERVRIAAFLMRFSPATMTNYAKLLAPADSACWPSVATDDLFDFLILQADAKNWPVLAGAASTWLDHHRGSGLQRTYAADFLFLASFHMHKKDGQAKRPSLVPTPTAVIDRLTGHIAPDSRNMHIYRGLALCLAGRVRASVDEFVAANARGGATLQYFRSAEHVMDWPVLSDLRDRASAEVAAGALPPPLHTTEHHVRHDSRDGCLLISCDIHYFNDYIDHLCESFGLHNPGGLLELHCVRFHPDAARLDALEATANIRINYTVDPAPGMPENSDIFRGYCAGARYLWLPHYLAGHDFVAVADIDGVIVRALPGLWNQAPNAVLMLTAMDLDEERSSNAIWGHIAAGIFALRNRPDHRVYAHMLAHFMAARFRAACAHGEKFFYADQTALMQCYLMLRDRCDFAKIGRSFFRQGGRTATAERRHDKKSRQRNYIDEARTGKTPETGNR